MSDLTGDLLREVARIQQDKTLLEVIDVITKMPVEKGKDYFDRRGLTATEFRTEALSKLKTLMREGS